MAATFFQETTATLRDFLPQLIYEMERHVPYASVAVFSMTGMHIAVDVSKEAIDLKQPQIGAVITVYDGERLWEAATHVLTPDHLRRKALELVQRALPVKNGAAIVTGAVRSGHFEAEMARRPEDVPLREKLELVKERFSYGRALDARLANFIVHYEELREQKLFVDRSANVSQDLTRLMMMGIALASDGTAQEYEAKGHSTSGGFERMQLSDELLVEAKDGAVALLGAEWIEPGTYEMIASPIVAGLIAHEAFGHGTEIDMFLKDRAKGREYLGKQIASPIVTMYDDPTIEGGYGSHFIDDQGQPATRTTMIENGILTQGIGDLYSTSLLGLPRTSNGRRESYMRKAYSRMTNTYFATGENSVDEMMDSVDHGVYLESGESGMEDPKSWGIQCTIHSGREIKKGKFTGKMFKSMALTGYVPDLLGSISMVGSEFHLGADTCGKGHKEWVPVTDGGPHLLLRGRLG